MHSFFGVSLKPTSRSANARNASEWLKQSLFRWLIPSRCLVALWILMVFKQVEGITPLVFSATMKTCSTIAFLLLLIPALFFPVDSVEKKAERYVAWAFPLFAGGLIVWILCFLARYFGRFGYHVSLNNLVTVGALFGGLAACGWVLTRQNMNSRRQLLLLGLSWVVVSLAWTVPLHNFPLDGDRSDMLPSIVATARDLLAGQNPYRWHEVGTHRVPVTKLPMLWLTYVPLVALRLDPRWIMLPAQLALLGLYWIALRQHLTSPWWKLLLWMALNPFLFLRHDCHLYILWPFVAATLLCMLRRRWIPAAVMWGLLLAFRKTLWVPYPFYLGFLLWNVGWRTALRCGLITTLIALLIIVPFFLASPTVFVDGVMNYQRSVSQQIPNASWPQVAGWTTGFSFVPIIYLAGLSHYLELIQVVVLAVVFMVMMLRRPNLAGTLQIMSTALLLVLLLNPLIEVYMYAPLLIFVTFAALAREGSFDRPPVASSLTDCLKSS